MFSMKTAVGGCSVFIVCMHSLVVLLYTCDLYEYVEPTDIIRSSVVLLNSKTTPLSDKVCDHVCY